MQPVFTPAILTHTAAALAALAIGIAIFLRPKGSFTHRILGRAWAGLMLLTAISSFWIQSTGGFSWIHGLSLVTVILLARAVMYALSHSIRAHQRTMKSLFYGTLIIAGAFTLLPHRLLGRMLWSTLGVV